MEAEECGGVRKCVDTFMEGSRSPYTLYLPAHRTHVDDPLLAILGSSRMVNDNKEVDVS